MRAIALVTVLVLMAFGCGDPSVQGADATCDPMDQDAALPVVFVAPETATASQIAAVCAEHGGDPITNPMLVAAAIDACDGDPADFCWIYAAADWDPEDGRPIVRTSSGTMYSVLGDVLTGRPACVAR